MKRSVILMVAAGCAVSTAQAQDIAWNNAAGGSWNTAANWLPINVPDAPGERAIIDLAGPYVVTVNSGIGVDGIVLTGAGAAVHIANAIVLTTRGDVTNNQLIVVNASGGGNGTHFQFTADAHLMGTGIVQLNSHPGNLGTGVLSTSGVGSLIRHDAGHTIRGLGRISGAMINAGTVDADINTRVMDIDAAMSNSGLMRASNGGVLTIGSTVAQDPSGVIRATGANSVVQFQAANVTGGLVEGVDGGVVNIINNTVFTDVHAAGASQVLNAHVLVVRGAGLTSDGTILVNHAAAGNGTFVQFEVPGLLGGSGQLILNAHPNNLGTGVLRSFGAGNSVTVGPAHTVRGTGRISGALINNGVVRSDVNGRTLDIDASVTNTNVLTALAGTRLHLSNNAVAQGTGASISADGPGAFVDLANTTITGGLVRGISGGIATVNSGNAVLLDVTTDGQLQVANARVMQVRSTGITNNATITVNPSASGNGTYVQCESHATIGGNGDIRLNCHPGNLETAVLRNIGADTSVTLGPDQLVHGAGRISGTLTNNGAVNADFAARILELNANTTNNNLLTATGGGVMNIAGVTVTQMGAGRIICSGAGSIVNFANPTIIGGPITATKGGVLRVSGGNAAFHSVTLAGTAFVENSRVLQIRGTGLTNNGTITVNEAGAGNGTYIQFEVDGALAGTGQIVLNCHPGNLETGVLRNLGAGTAIHHGAGHTVRGKGRINGIFENNGTVNADTAPGIDLGATITNNNLITATNAATASFSSSTITQSPAGVLRANGGTLFLNNPSITGGTIEAINGGVSRVAGGNAVLTNVTVNGPMGVENSRVLVVRGNGLTNNGVITVNEVSAGNGTYVQFETAGTLAGTGAIILNCHPGNFETGVLRPIGAGNSILNTAAHTVGGRGRVYAPFTNAGHVAPGGLNGGTARLEMQGAWTIQPTSNIDIDLGGTGQGSTFDHLVCSAPTAVGGTLNVQFVNGFLPARGATFDIITAPSITGQFTTVNLPELPATYGFARVQYTPTSVRIRIPQCRADWNGTDGGNSQDFFDFLTDFFGGNSDYNRDNVTNSQDFFDFLTDFFTPCVP